MAVMRRYRRGGIRFGRGVAPASHRRAATHTHDLRGGGAQPRFARRRRGTLDQRRTLLTIDNGWRVVADSALSFFKQSCRQSSWSTLRLASPVHQETPIE
jgi:hypothetical protein